MLQNWDHSLQAKLQKLQKLQNTNQTNGYTLKNTSCEGQNNELKQHKACFDKIF
jgi:hypothetical protein